MEQLLILSIPDLETARRRIEVSAKIVQEGSDKLLVVEGPATAILAATQIPGVSTPDSLSSDAAKNLTASEQVFLQAWRQRQESAGKKHRIGEALSWGSKGFKAP